MMARASAGNSTLNFNKWTFMLNRIFLKKLFVNNDPKFLLSFFILTIF